jgi:hypothetical protein
MEEERRGLDDTDDARFAWARYRRILGWMNLVAIAVGAGTVLFLWYGESIPWIFAALTFGGIYLTILMAAALMGLMFLSDGTGHDEHIIDLTKGAHPLDD